MMDVSKNAERFMGYADVYHMARPRGPRFVVDCLINYLGLWNGAFHPPVGNRRG